jgi:peptidoglycan/xylan/chitin deacetylase (PgdA/CDA1 family)
MFIFLACIAVTALPLMVGIGAVVLKGRSPALQGPSGLLFHMITSRRLAHFSHYSPDKFKLLIETISNRKTATATVKETLDDPARRVVVITFDDGFETFFTEAFPVLEAYGVKATLFPIAGFIGRRSEWDALPLQQHLSKAQIREISDCGHEIGSHTMTHADLTMLPMHDLEGELRDSKAALEDITGRPVVSLSFPFGSWNKRVWETARSVGYTCAAGYRSEGRIEKGMLPVQGVYSFDTVQDVFDKITPGVIFLNAAARARITSHFAKGTPLWKFRKNYLLVQ